MNIPPSSATLPISPASNFPSIPLVQDQITPPSGSNFRLDRGRLLQDSSIVPDRDRGYIKIDWENFVNLVNKTVALTYVCRGLDRKTDRLVRLLSTVRDLANDANTDNKKQELAEYVKKTLRLISSISKLLDEQQALERSNVLYPFFSDRSVVNHSPRTDPSALFRSSRSVLYQLPKCICDLMKTSHCHELVPPLLNLNFPESTSFEAYQIYFQTLAPPLSPFSFELLSTLVEKAKDKAWKSDEKGIRTYSPSLFHQMVGSDFLLNYNLMTQSVFRLLFPRSESRDLTSLNLNWETRLYKDNIEGIREEHQIALIRALLARYTHMHQRIIQQKLDDFPQNIMKIYYFKKAGVSVAINPSLLTYAEEVLFSSASLPDQSDISWKKGLVISLIEEGSAFNIEMVQRALKRMDPKAIERYFSNRVVDKNFYGQWLKALPDIDDAIRKQHKRIAKHLATVPDSDPISKQIWNALSKELWDIVFNFLYQPLPQPLPPPIQPSASDSIQQLAISVHAIVQAYSLSHAFESSELDNHVRMEPISQLLQNRSTDLVVPPLLETFPQNIRLYFQAIAQEQFTFIDKKTLSALVDRAKKQAGNNPRIYCDIVGRSLLRATEMTRESEDFVTCLMSPLAAMSHGFQSVSSEIDNKLKTELISRALRSPLVELIVLPLLTLSSHDPQEIRSYFEIIAKHTGFANTKTLSALVEIAKKQAGSNLRVYCEILGPDLLRAARVWPSEWVKSILSPLNSISRDSLSSFSEIDSKLTMGLISLTLRSPLVELIALPLLTMSSHDPQEIRSYFEIIAKHTGFASTKTLSALIEIAKKQADTNLRVYCEILGPDLLHVARVMSSEWRKSILSPLNSMSRNSLSSFSEIDNKLKTELVTLALQNHCADLMVSTLLTIPSQDPQDVQSYFKIIAQVGFVGEKALSALLAIANQQAGNNALTYFEIIGRDILTRAAENWEPAIIQSLVDSLRNFPAKIKDPKDAAVIKASLNNALFVCWRQYFYSDKFTDAFQPTAKMRIFKELGAALTDDPDVKQSAAEITPQSISKSTPEKRSGLTYAEQIIFTWKPQQSHAFFNSSESEISRDVNRKILLLNHLIKFEHISLDVAKIQQALPLIREGYKNRAKRDTPCKNLNVALLRTIILSYFDKDPLVKIDEIDAYCDCWQKQLKTIKQKRVK